MLKQVQIKNYAVAEIEVDKEKTQRIIEALGNAIADMKKHYPQEKQKQICALMDLKDMFDSIDADFS
jgi:hypothetical protein